MAPVRPLRPLTGPASNLPPISLREAYRLRWKRRRLLWRSFRSRHQLTSLVDRTAGIGPHDVLAVMTQRNEMLRLPWFLQHYRQLGVSHFLIVDNGSDDGSATYLAEQPDVSLWQTRASYRGARFGLDWMTWLQIRYAHKHWCLMVDADELLIYDGYQTRDLRDLTAALDRAGQVAFGALMLDLYPEGPVGGQTYAPGDDPTGVLRGFDVGTYRAQRQPPMGNLWVQGGIRERVFFADNPERSPTLNKLPLVRWNRRYTYVNSTHALLPRSLNAAYDGPGDPRPCGVILHTKFLPDATARATDEKLRGEHFNQPAAFDGYYDTLRAGPTLWHAGTTRYENAAQLVGLGLMSVWAKNLSERA